MDDDIMIVPRTRFGEGPEGVCSSGFASCFALVLSSPLAVGLVHSSGIRGFQSDIEDAQEEFNLTTGGAGRLTVGFSSQGYRASLTEMAERLSAAEFADDMRQSLPLPGADEALQKARIIERLVVARQSEAMELARQNGGTLVMMPHSMLAVGVDGTLHTFDGYAHPPTLSPVD